VTPPTTPAELSLAMIRRASNRPLPEATYQIGSRRYRCRSEVAELFDAVTAFLPWPAQKVTGTEDFELTLVVDSELLASLRCVLSRQPADELIETFAGETWRQCFKSHQGTVFLEPEGGDRSYCVSREGSRISVIVSRRTATTHLVRCLRELHLRTVENGFGLSMHAAAVTRGDRGFLIAGSKGAGKTSLTLALCLGSGFHYLANDRAMVVPDGTGLQLLPFPLACRVGFGTALHLPALRRLLMESTSLCRSQPEALACLTSPEDLRPGDHHPDSKLELTPHELVRRLGIVHAREAQLSAVVIPVLEPDRGRVDLELLSPARTLEVLERECLTPREEKWVAPWLIPRRAASDLWRRRHLTLRRLADSIPAAALHFGSDYGQPAILTRIESCLAELGAQTEAGSKALRNSLRKRSAAHSSA
jgi:hypothetical protein